MAGGAAAILLGLMTLTIQYTMAATHTWNGVNYANAFNILMTIVGMGLLALGGAWIGNVHIHRRESVNQNCTALVSPHNPD